MNKLSIGILSSHGGSNMQAVVEAIKDGKLSAEISVLISNNSKSKVMERAHQENIPNYHLSQAKYPNPEQLDKNILKTLQDHNAEYILLLGYMKKLGPLTLSRYKNRMINIHPSLLPKYGGRGMYGHHVHAAVLENKEIETGVTIHLVDEEYDTGNIISQQKVPVFENDTVEDLSERVLVTEHQLLVDTLCKICEEGISLWEHPVGERLL
ncbi:phosphoribosylglycinamide formyltransferase [Chengkuizengella axinellae]|uniref:Phosphoribosylglycinamide formyltransferase n=1 Tax=Chengkuizengella axinellae TaxID=3064388 RepID=A0ABT9IUB4_9BACL|nr:phosphoribosylglycinamide formyltransferase [Chengkuizengella sp. 2205SS18-9]MDP5272878.1 phosphoribosylglycinamide formyltransferase [Chengkuizengella sp. 2205SS18-9]